MEPGKTYGAGETPAKGKEAEPFGRIAERVESAAERALEQGREVGEQVRRAADDARRTVDKSLKEQPFATLAVAAIIGFVLGALWKS